MPHHVVIAEALAGVEPCAERVEQAAQRNERHEGRRSVADEQREEEDDRPAHDQVDSQTDGGYRFAGQGFVENPENHHRPLQDGDEHPLPAADDRQRDGCVAARDGDVDENVVEDVENLLVLRLRVHRMVERRGEEHQEDRNDENRDRDRGQNPSGIMHIGPHGGERKGQQRQKRHHAVRHGIADFLADRRHVNCLFLVHSTTVQFYMPNL